MHIPENYLSPETCAVMTVAMVPVWAHAVRKVKAEVSRTRMPLLGVAAAFSFVGMMFNVPMPGGTTGHAVGGTLIALLLGPNAACIAVTIALLIQALLFGDGGILSFGANCFNMAFVLPFLGYAVAQLIAGKAPSNARKIVSAAIGSYVGINAAAFCAAVEFGIQPMLFHNAAGQALYCPYDLSISIPAMMIGHLTVFGIVEAIYTSAVLAYVLKTSPAMLRSNAQQMTPVEGSTQKPFRPVYALLGILVCLVPIGLLATGTAWGEWGAEEMAKLTEGGQILGYTPQGMSTGFSFESIMPDYSISGLPEVAAYILSAVIGVAILVLVFRLIASMMKEKINFE